jgi:hypothetical protein
MTLPNFLIIGAAKSSTSAMYHYLKQHPNICMSLVKEPDFFAYVKDLPVFCGPGDEMIRRRAVVQLADYQALFQDAREETALGEASTIYLSSYHPHQTAENIHDHIPHVRLIAILRQPADRAYSNFSYYRQLGMEPEANFKQALAEEQTRLQAGWRPGWRYRLNGLYYANLKPYFERFKREQIRVYVYDDWQSNPHQILRDVFGFLDVDETFTPDITKRHNTTFVPRSVAIQKFLLQPNQIKSLFKHLLPQRLRRAIILGLQSLNHKKHSLFEPELRRQLTEGYREDILKLQDLIGRDLSHWLTG